MKILDACCGGKMFWYEKDLDFVTFQDVRAGVKEYSGGRKIRIEDHKAIECVQRAINRILGV